MRMVHVLVLFHEAACILHLLIFRMQAFFSFLAQTHLGTIYTSERERLGRTVQKRGQSDPLECDFSYFLLWKAEYLNIEWISAKFVTDILYRFPHYPYQYQGQKYQKSSSQSHLHILSFHHQFSFVMQENVIFHKRICLM